LPLEVIMGLYRCGRQSDLRQEGMWDRHLDPTTQVKQPVALGMALLHSSKVPV
jgi:hypothetical protein